MSNSTLEAEHQGSVKLGEFSSFAIWTDGDIFSIRFPIGLLNRDQVGLLSSLKLSPQPVLLQRTGPQVMVRVIGFEENLGWVTFHVTKADPSPVTDYPTDIRPTTAMASRPRNGL
jgi:hypothetical protein